MSKTLRRPIPSCSSGSVNDAQTLCRALGYDLNTVEFAVEDGIPYAIDFLNPAPDADIHSVGQENFDWIVNAVAEMAVKKALSDENPVRELRWASFLSDAKPARLRKRKPPRRRKQKPSAFLCDLRVLCGQKS